MGRRLGSLRCQMTTDVDDVVGDDAETYPDLHSGRSFIAASAQPVAAFEHADPVRHFMAFLNQRDFCRCFRASLLVEWLGIATRFTPICWATVSLVAEKNPASAATRCGTRPNCCSCFSMDG